MSKQSTPIEDQLREKLAAIEHERWADWQKWVHKQLRRPDAEDGTPWLLPDETFQRWQRQIYTNYQGLSEKEKQSDREQVDRYWPLIKEYIAHLASEAKPDKKVTHPVISTNIYDSGWNEATDTYENNILRRLGRET